MSPLRELWIKWKMLKLPWRKKFLVGQDLSGNTFWEFKDALSHDRMRRIVKANKKQYMSDLKISPQWHQWLRQTRAEPPSIQEQQMDITRQIQLAHNARLADERWAAKARYIEKPKAKSPRTTMGGDPEVQEGQETIAGGDAPKTESASKEGVRSGISDTAKPTKENPWAYDTKEQKQNQTGSNPGAGWQPEAWVPGFKKR